MDITAVITSLLTLLVLLGAIFTAIIQSSSVMTSIALAMSAYNLEHLGTLEKANVVEEEIDDFTQKMEEGHIARMEKGICTPSVGAQYLELSSNAERMADHMINIAKSIRAL